VTNGAAGQHNIVDTVPGQNNYSPLWRVTTVTWKAGVKPRILKSAAQVHQAEAAGDVAIKQTATVVNCPVLGFGQKRITGFSNGHTIHYYDDVLRLRGDIGARSLLYDVHRRRPDEIPNPRAIYDLDSPEGMRIAERWSPSQVGDTL
jgi:hypothetical protein